MQKLSTLLCLASLLAASAAQAENLRDRIGGQDQTTQTIAHCGYLKTQKIIYTGTPVTTRLVQKKLTKLGFYRGPLDGVYGRASKDAVRRFQDEYGLSADGVVGPMTVQRLAYFTHPRANVRRCWRLADARFR